MKTPLVNIQILSIYKLGDKQVMLPNRMAKCTPDMYRAVMAISAELMSLGGSLELSDMFRSYDMQFQAHADYISGKKKAYSPPPGGSLHEAGRSMDIDLSKIKITLAKFWEIAAKYGVFPIISEPNASTSEAWHFDCRGSHGIVYNYYKNGKASNMPAYTAMAVSAILSAGIQVDEFAGNNDEAFIQSGLIRLGYDIGPIDGDIGKKTNAALLAAGVTATAIAEKISAIESLLDNEFPEEYMLPNS